ncbi:MAG: nucleoside triphosphate pyrophosphohydrolase [Myxococcales bacterium]|nr:nucleoside triphosphate pyrophosphohydrolase [Myxococcales bacterium]
MTERDSKDSAPHGSPETDLRRGENLPELVDVMQRLLAPGGCPWDREQTLASLRPYVIEEAFEVVDAIDGGSPDALRDELGDLLLQIVFQAELARQKGWFTPNDVVVAICEKLIRRHPHVFGDVRVSGADEVVKNWEAIKQKEKGAKGERGRLEGVPRALPALLRAVRVGEKAASVGYDWPDASGARAKIDEELRELDEAAAAGDQAAMEGELGDALFAMASYARKQGLDPEAALRGTLARFSARFAHVESAARERGMELAKMTAAELDGLWREAKAKTA